MSEFELVKLTDLLDLAQSQKNKGENLDYTHPIYGKMTIDGWVLYTLKNADLKDLKKFIF